MFFKKVIFIGLLIVLGILFVPTPQRPIECGGGSVVWRTQSTLENANDMEKVILEDLAKHNPEFPNSKNLYWDKLSDGKVIYCKTFYKNGVATWVFDRDRPNAMLVRMTSSSGEF